jgi:hypothetical protein
MKKRIEALKEMNRTLKELNKATAGILKQQKDHLSNAGKISSMIKNLSEKKPTDSKVPSKPMSREKLMEEFLKMDTNQLEQKSKEFKEMVGSKTSKK